MSLTNRVANLERSLSMINQEIIIVFQQGKHFLVHRDNRGIVNEVYGSIEEVNLRYKDCLGVIVTFKELADIQQVIEGKKNLVDVNILTTATEEQNYSHFIEVIKEKAEMIKNIQPTETGAINGDL